MEDDIVGHLIKGRLHKEGLAMPRRRNKISFTRLTARIPRDVHEMMWGVSSLTGISLNGLICLALHEQVSCDQRVLTPRRAPKSLPRPEESQPEHLNVRNEPTGGNDAAQDRPNA